MLHSQRLDQRLNTLRKEVRTMTREKDRGDWVWRDRLQCCQRQLKAKEEEMSRQSQHFESFKSQLQHKLSAAWDREQSSRNRNHVLEKQLLHMTVSAAVGTATSSAVRITASTVTHWEEQQRLPSTRGEGEGEEERKEERRGLWQPSDNGTERGGDRVDDEVKNSEREMRESKTKSNEARLQDFILSLQEDLRVLLEREENGTADRKGLMEQLLEAQEKSQLMCCKVEDVKAEVRLLKESESSLMEEIKDLSEENHRLQQIFRDIANQAPSSSPVVPPVSSNAFSYTTAMGRSSLGKVAAENAQKKEEGQSSSAKSVPPPNNVPLNRFHHLNSEANLCLQSPSLTTETVDEFEMGTWCSRGLLNLEECPSEESDALREAYRSLQSGAEPEALKEKCGNLKIAPDQLRMKGQEKTQPELPIRKEEEEKEIEMKQQPSGEKMNMLPANDGAEDNILALTQDDLMQALNQENGALADRLRELLEHIEIREERIQSEETLLRHQISKFEVDRARLEQESQEQGCLITELTKKTEDDLNTIMELQQKLVEGEKHIEQLQAGQEQCESQSQSGDVTTIPGPLQQDDLEESVDRLVESVLKEEKQSFQEPGAKTTALRHENDLLQNSQQSSLQVTYEVDQLTKLVQSLKVEQKELSGRVNVLRTQQEEVAASVQTQTEAKQQLTRVVWGLKEEKDIVSQSLASLKYEREQLTKAACSMEAVPKSLSAIQREKETLLESLSCVTEERDQIRHALQTLQTESDQLSRAVLDLKEEKSKLTRSHVHLKEPGQHGQSHVLEDGCDKLIKSVGNLRDEKERLGLSISDLKREEEQRKLLLQGLREESSGPGATLSSQSHREGRSQHPPAANRAATTKTSDCLLWTGELAARRHQIRDGGNHLEENDERMREIESLRVELKKSRDELDKSHEDARRMQQEFCQSETRREEAETKAVQMADEVSRLTVVANQIEGTRKKNEAFVTQVKELQSKLTALLREKTDALSLKAQTEQQHTILTAQLRAKTAALEELNSEYVALKQGRGGREDLDTLLVSLGTRYNNMRSKYDALLKKKSPNELDTAPLKAKLSCLVAKCRQRNGVLVQMMEAMHSRGCRDAALTRQVEQLLNDAALRDYAAAFTPGNESWTRTSDLMPDFISKCQCFSAGATSERNGFSPDSLAENGELKREKYTPRVSSESTRSQTRSSEVTTSLAGMLKKDVDSPGMPLPGAALKEGSVTNTAQLSSSASGPVQATSRPEPFRLNHPDLKGKFSPDPSSLSGSSVCPAPPSVRTYVSPKRRMSSPEKILKLHEQLHKTLKSVYEVQAPVSRGRGEQPRTKLSLSSAVDLGQACLTKKQDLSPSTQHANPRPATITPALTAAPVPSKSMTLLKAVASRSAHVTFNPNMFTGQHLKGISKTTTSALSSSSHLPPPVQAKSMAASGPTVTLADTCHVKGPAITLNASISNPDTSRCSETNPKITAHNITSDLDLSQFNTPFKRDSADPAYDAPSFAASCTPEKSYKFTRKSAAAREETMTAGPKPEAPAEVCSVEVIRTVGQGSLLIGWERPSLDELGCSNGTFVYGYRVIVNGDFHKSVLSAACTKCILENVDLTVPVDISVQTLGCNGLSSNIVGTMWTG
ncbi:trichohyalin-like [Brachionichthys hirsutus]|uniref:trichohyalin-like n=1 Tax=Brachionichthys hirsutus TaxID=412623 RepID=UPI0036046013